MAVDGADALSKDLLAFASDLRSQKLLSQIGLAVERTVKKRTREGVDVEGNAFEPYSESHAKKRAAEGLPTDTVDLKFSQYNASMDDLDHVVANDLETVSVLFTSDRAQEIMRYHNIEGAGKSKVIRRNMELSDEEADEIDELVEEHLEDILDIHDLS